MTKHRIAIIECAKLYKIEYPYIINLGNLRKFLPKVNKDGYPHISFRRRKLDIDHKVPVHGILAYQKYGDEIFKEKIMCRHLNNDKTDFREENLCLGYALDNHNDNNDYTKSKIVTEAKKGAKKLRKLNNTEIISLRKDHKNGMNYKQLSEKYNICRTSISYIINNKSYKDIQ